MKLIATLENNPTSQKACKASLTRTIAVAVFLSGVFGSVMAGTTAYIPGYNGGISVVDTSTHTQTAVVNLVPAGVTSNHENHSISVSPNGNVAYATMAMQQNAVFPINTTTNAVGTPIPVGLNPWNVTFSPNSAFAYVSNLSDNSISVIDVSMATVSTTVPSICPSGTLSPVQSVFHGAKLLILCSGSPSVVISMDTSASNALTPLATTVGHYANNIAISTASGFGYVSNYIDAFGSTGNVSKFDLTTGVTTNYPTTGVSGPWGLAVTPDGNKIYVADAFGSNLIVMNPSGTILSTLNLGGPIAGLGMSSNGSVIYAPLQGYAAGIKVINTATDAVTATIANPGARALMVYGNFLANVSASAAPAATAVNPNAGSTAGGTAITITGTDLTGASAITVGGTACTNVIVASATSATCTTPAGTAGAASVLVTTPGGTNAGNTLFTYVTPPTVTAVNPNTGSTAGGTAITITGSDLTGASAITVGGTACTNVIVASATSATCTTPAGTAGAASVLVTTSSGTTAANTLFTYVTPVAAPIPTLSEWAMIFLASLMGLFSYLRMRRQS